MVDHVRTLLLNRQDWNGHVSDPAVNETLALFGVSGLDDSADEAAIDAVLPLAMADDLAWCRSHFDQRVTRRPRGSVYAASAGPSLDGLYGRVLGDEGRWKTAGLFIHADPSVASELAKMRAAAFGMDAPYALGAVLLACAYRRLVAQTGGD